ncbi:MAG: hypothetical protein QXR60_05450, partial [Candidatus Nanoarchaeia archaeon]
MAFVSDYWHTLDRQSEIASRLDVTAKDIGISHGAGDVLEGLQAHIREGATAVELGFTGTGKGAYGGQQTTPEMFGKDKREAMRQLAKVNEVVLSTHASVGVQGISGLDPHENAFTPKAAEEAIHEIERTVDFAADVAGGGPVVIHGSEFPREVSERYKEFEMYEEEAKKTPVYLVNKRTGKIEAALTKDTRLPIIKRDENGNPIFNEKENRYEVELLDFGEFQRRRGIKDSQKAAVEFYKENVIRDQLGRIDFEERRWRHDYERAKGVYEYLEESRRVITDLLKKNPPLAKFQAIQVVKEIGEAPPTNSKEYLKFLDDPISYLNRSIETHKNQLKFQEDAATFYAQERAYLKE